MKGNLLIVHGGGPTAVINSSLYGVLKTAYEIGSDYKIYGARNGTGGLLKNDLIDLSAVPSEELELLLQTPGSAIGTSRDPLEEAEYERMLEIIQSRNIKHILLNGGNGTMDTCGKLFQLIEAKELDINVIGIPKTMDNDLNITDHSPGYGSAAKYIAQVTKEVCCDVRGLPIHVVIIEASGRNAGWITAASALADPSGEFSPDLIYLPEVPFNQKQFLKDIESKLKEKSGLVVVVSEGLKDETGKPIVEPVLTIGRATYFGDVSTHLAMLIIKELGYKARGEKPGLIGRASVLMRSERDIEEAILAGSEAFKAVVKGESGKMVAFRRLPSDDYQIETILVDIHNVMLTEKTMPAEFINHEGNGVTQAFIDWCQPLIGSPLTDMIAFN